MLVESFKKYCEEMKEKGTACDISRAANDLHTRSTELVKQHEHYNRQRVEQTEQLKFTPSSAATGTVSNLIGTIDHGGACSEKVLILFVNGKISL